MPSSTKRKPKVVLDTNIWVSALLWGGKPAEIIKAAEHGKFSIFISEEIVMEISRVLTYDKIVKIYEAEGLPRDQLVETVLKIAKFIKVTKKVKAVLARPAEDKVIECALAAKADYIVSGDKHLLELTSHKETKILSVSEFLKLLP
jgi:putative PIN family toxin of toxin-antitoxin system